VARSSHWENKSAGLCPVHRSFIAMSGSGGWPSQSHWGNKVLACVPLIAAFDLRIIETLNFRFADERPGTLDLLGSGLKHDKRRLFHAFDRFEFGLDVRAE
jgi:hypothetical protein